MVALVLIAGLDHLAARFRDASRPWLWPAATWLGLALIWVAFWAWRRAKAAYFADRFFEMEPPDEFGVSLGPAPSLLVAFPYAIVLFASAALSAVSSVSMKENPVAALGIIAAAGNFVFVPKSLAIGVNRIPKSALPILRYKLRVAADGVCERAGRAPIAVEVDLENPLGKRRAMVRGVILYVDALTVRDFEPQLLEAVIAVNLPNVPHRAPSKAVLWRIFFIYSTIVVIVALFARQIDLFRMMLGVSSPQLGGLARAYEDSPEFPPNITDRWAADLIGFELVEKALIAMGVPLYQRIERGSCADKTLLRIGDLRRSS